MYRHEQNQGVQYCAQVTVVTDDTKFEECSYYTSTHGYECVPYYQCEDGEILTDGAGLFDIRFAAGKPTVVVLDASDKKCPGTLDVCCK